MTHTEIIFIAARSGIVVLCLVSLLVVGRQAWIGRHLGGSQWPILVCTAGLMLAAAVLTVNDLYAALSPGEQMATYAGAWLWLVFDAGVPLLMIHVLRLIAQRDAAVTALERLSVTDALTGLPNRRGFAEAAKAALRESRRRGEAASVVMFDLDRFKAINDGHGHAAGDAVLREAAAAVRRELRAGDVAGRLGGEEFAVLCPATTAAEAMAVAERMREAVRDGVRHPAGGGALVTTSAGVAEVRDGQASVEAALSAADRALYAAKAAGRDRVVIADTITAAAD